MKFMTCIVTAGSAVEERPFQGRVGAHNRPGFSAEVRLLPRTMS
jgi:hypothetical protein